MTTKTKNEQLFKILDHMFPREFEMWNGNLCKKPKTLEEIARPGEDFDPMTDMEYAFWLADKVGLFGNENYRCLHKAYSNDRWYVSEFGYDFKGIKCIETGDTPQEAIVNAIIAIHGNQL